LIRLVLKAVFALTVLSALCIVLTRAQSYDDSEVRIFLTPPDGCPAPCFMGIRPGVTTLEEATAILSAMGWRAEEPVETNTTPTYFFFSPSSSASPLDLVFIHVVDPPIIRDITLETHLPLASVLVDLGEPDSHYYVLAGGGEGGTLAMIEEIIYSQQEFTLSVSVACPAVERADFFDAPVLVFYTSGERTYGLTPRPYSTRNFETC
jgi:hypothetical protein